MTPEARWCRCGADRSRREPCRCTRPYQLPGRPYRPGARPRRPAALAALWPFVRPLIPGALIIAASIAARLTGAA